MSQSLRAQLAALRLKTLITVAECPVELSKCHLLANPAFPVPSPRFRQ
jgi:hypothetical protein